MKEAVLFFVVIAGLVGGVMSAGAIAYCFVTQFIGGIRITTRRRSPQ